MIEVEENCQNQRSRSSYAWCNSRQPKTTGSYDSTCTFTFNNKAQILFPKSKYIDFRVMVTPIFYSKYDPLH